MRPRWNELAMDGGSDHILVLDAAGQPPQQLRAGLERFGGAGRVVIARRPPEEMTDWDAVFVVLRTTSPEGSRHLLGRAVELYDAPVVAVLEDRHHPLGKAAIRDGAFACMSPDSDALLLGQLFDEIDEERFLSP